MALKAGLVGVNPKGVDKNGMPIGSAGNAVDEAQLTANGKQFHFAYDETSEKYGYKLDGAGDFIPFESAGSVGLNIPDPITTGIQLSGNVELVKGGYQIVEETSGDDTRPVAYADIYLHATEAGSWSIQFPFYFRGCAGLILTTDQLKYVETAGGAGYPIGDYSQSSAIVDTFAFTVTMEQYIRLIMITRVRTN